MLRIYLYLFYRRNSAPLINWLQVDVHCPAAESPSVDSIQLCITAYCVFISAFIRYVKYYFHSIYCEPLQQSLFLLSLRMLLFSSVVVIEVVGVLYWKIYGLISKPLNTTNVEGHFTLTIAQHAAW